MKFINILLQVVINLLSSMISVTSVTDIIKKKSSSLTIKTRKGEKVHVTFYECDMTGYKTGCDQWLKIVDRINQYHTLQELPQELLAEYAIYVTGMFTANPAYFVDVSVMRRETKHKEFIVMFDKTLRNSSQFLPVMFHELGHIYLEHYNRGVLGNTSALDLTVYDEHMCDKFAQKATGKKIDLMAVITPYYELMVQYGVLTKVEADNYTALVMKDVQEVRH